MASLSSRETVIEEEVQLEGTLEFERKVTFKGRFEGSIAGTGTVVVDKSARVNADIKAHSIYISGKVIGDCISSDLFEMTKHSFLRGNIKAKKIKIADEVKFEGQCKMWQ